MVCIVVSAPRRSRASSSLLGESSPGCLVVGALVEYAFDVGGQRDKSEEVLGELALTGVGDARREDTSGRGEGQRISFEISEFQNVQSLGHGHQCHRRLLRAGLVTPGDGAATSGSMLLLNTAVASAWLPNDRYGSNRSPSIGEMIVPPGDQARRSSAGSCVERLAAPPPH